MSFFKPTDAATKYLIEAPTIEIAQTLPTLTLPKVKLDDFNGEIGESVKCDFSGQKVGDEELTLQHR
jgi:hypothetical protein